MDTTSQEKYEDKMENAGMCRMAVWIPDDQRDRLSKYAKSLRTKQLSKLKREARDEAP
jgi:hypothetical protein